jgi:hypothetical protein
MSTTNITDDDEGKEVVTSDGDSVGMVTEVRGGAAYVDPDPDMVDRLKSKLDWGDTDGGYPIQADDVADVTDDQIRLR